MQLTLVRVWIIGGLAWFALACSKFPYGEHVSFYSAILGACVGYTVARFWEALMEK